MNSNERVPVEILFELILGDARNVPDIFSSVESGIVCWIDVLSDEDVSGANNVFCRNSNQEFVSFRHEDIGGCIYDEFGNAIDWESVFGNESDRYQMTSTETENIILMLKKVLDVVRM